MKTVPHNISDKLLQTYLKTGDVGDHPDLMIMDEYTEFGKGFNRCPFCNTPTLTNKHPMSFLSSIPSMGGRKRATVFLCEHHGKMYKEALSEVQSKSNILNPRLLKYLASEEMPLDADEYALGNKKENYCVFCSGSVKNDLDRLSCTTQHIPVGQYDRILGYVKVCLKCSEVIDTYMDTTEATPDPKVFPDRCIDCGNQYPVTERELDTRKLKGTLGQHYCQDCVADDYHLVNYDRYLALQCAYKGCTNTAVVDLTLDPNTTQYWCKEHLQEEDDKFTFEYGSNNEISLTVYLSRKDDKWHFLIVDNVKHVILKRSVDEDNSSDIEETTFAGAIIAEEIYDNTYGKIQPKLFP